MTRIVDLRKKVRKTEKILPEKGEFPLIDPKKIKSDPPESVTEKLVKNLNRFEWEAPSFYYNPHKKYLALVVIALLSGAGALIFYNRDILMAIFLILSSFVIILYANKQPSVLRVVINNSGVIIDDTIYYYRNLKSFWIDYEPRGIKELSLESKKWYMPYIKIYIEKQNPLDIRSLMINFVPEKEHEKSLVDLISRKIGL
ncbi:MAG TPA: hypothetical protein VJC06_02975 [Candidatus Paceibacterota bacterium]